MARLSITLFTAALIASSPACAADPLAELRLSQVQVIGTHNSYHLAPDVVAAKFLQAVVPGEATANDYSHAPLVEQLQRLGVRQLELDLFLDPEGQLYHDPAFLQAAREQQTQVPPHDPEGLLKKPGIKILHSPDFDFRTTVYTFAAALRQIKGWSDEHREHSPLFLLLELKSESFSPRTRPPAWNATALDMLETEILASLPRERILTPSDIQGAHPTLREAILRDGWPTMRQARGKVILLLDNEDAVRDAYQQTKPMRNDRLLFVTVAREHPDAAWMKRNDVVGSFREIQELVKTGFLVRTRADSGTREARRNDVATRDKAFASGAQLISTDFPEVDNRFPDYAVRFEQGAMVRKNVFAPDDLGQ
ncbi:MAG TPA: Ca2+-dependent phosphoinositide-specific phospholipase C [Pirellulaceae bacterium]|nr:Ca2+-dependent phosphoinositide-specific phospholipase C [Pirellulaceae bacterium]